VIDLYIYEKKCRRALLLHKCIGYKDAYAGTYHVFLSKKERMGRETRTQTMNGEKLADMLLVNRIYLLIFLRSKY
jgi:hypothetical protein